MKKQIEVSEGDKCFEFSIEGEVLFSIDKEELVIDSKKLYEAFFKDLEGKPEYAFLIPDDASKSCKYVAGEFGKIIEQITERVDSAWFEGADGAEPQG